MNKIGFQELLMESKSELKDYKNKMLIVKLKLLEFKTKSMDLKMMIWLDKLMN